VRRSAPPDITINHVTKTTSLGKATPQKASINNLHDKSPHPAELPSLVRFVELTTPYDLIVIG
jgi:hypothetical protein